MKSAKNVLFLMTIILLSGSLVSCDQMKGSEQKAKPVANPQNVAEESKAKPRTSNEVAVVGSWRLSIEEFKQRLQNVAATIEDFDPENKESQALVLDELVRQQLLVIEAKRLGIHKDPEIREAVQDFEKTLLVQELATEITTAVEVTADQAREYYDANQGIFVLPVELKISEIVTKTQDEAKQILVQVLQGSDFGIIAKEKSIGDSASKNGDLGYISQAPFQEMAAAVQGIDTGDVSTIFKGPKGHYIVKIEDKRGGEVQPFDQIKDQLIQALTVQNRQQAVLQRLDEIAQRVNVEINDDFFGTSENSTEE